jgi:hypothetical protein
MSELALRLPNWPKAPRFRTFNHTSNPCGVDMRNPRDHRSDQPPSLRADLKSKSKRRRERIAAIAQASEYPPLRRSDLLPTLVVEQLRLADLVVPKRNVRRVEASHARGVANSIGALGFCNPVLLGTGNVSPSSHAPTDSRSNSAKIMIISVHRAAAIIHQLLSELDGSRPADFLRRMRHNTVEAFHDRRWTLHPGDGRHHIREAQP